MTKRNQALVGDIFEVNLGVDKKGFFRSSHDYGNPKVKFSERWYVWEFNREVV